MDCYNTDAHVNSDPNQQLLDGVWAVQQCVIKNQRELPFHTRLPILVSSSNIVQHQKNLEKNKRNFHLKTGFEWDQSQMSSELWALLDNGKLLELAEDIVYEHSYEPSPRFSVFTGYSKDFMNYQDNEEVRPKSPAKDTVDGKGKSGRGQKSTGPEADEADLEPECGPQVAQLIDLPVPWRAPVARMI